MNSGIYKLSDGSHIDLDRITKVNKVIDGKVYDYVDHYSFSVDCQLHDKPLWYSWHVDVTEIGWDKNLKELKNYVQEQHDLLIKEWIIRKENKHA